MMANNKNAFITKKGYHNGYRFCARCGMFRHEDPKIKNHCEDCHNRLRAWAKGAIARQKREAETKRF